MSFRTDYKDYGSAEKTLIKKEVFWKHQDNQPTWNDIKHLEFQDDDKIIIAYSEDTSDSGNGGWYISIDRWEEETDEQFAKRISDKERDAKWAKEARLKSYLRLKAEFEPDTK